MAYTATQLVTESYQIAQVNPRSLQTITGPELASGLQWLNEIISIKSAKTRMIPYFTKYNFVAVPNQEAYFIPGLIQVETFTFNIGPIRFPTVNINRDVYFGAARADNISSLPFSWHLERAFVDGVEGANMYIYFKPDQTYPLEILAKFALTQIPNELFDMTTAYTLYYIAYLKYALAQYICTQYSMTMHPDAKEKYRELERAIIDISPPDLTMQFTSAFGQVSAINFADALLYTGYRPVGRSYG